MYVSTVMHAGSGFSVPEINTVSLRSPPCKSLNGLRGRALLIKKWGPDVHPLIPRRIIPADDYAGRAWTDSTARQAAGESCVGVRPRNSRQFPVDELVA